jgi:hypothetical protein
VSELERQYFPSWRMGYRSNPFRSLTPQEWSDLAMLPEGLSSLIDSPPPLLQILGAQGAGKTSVLLALERTLHDQGWYVTYEYLPPGSNQVQSDLTQLQVYLLDEAQRLSPRATQRLFARMHPIRGTARHLVFSTHEDLSRYTAKMGLPMETFHLGQHSRNFTLSLIERRLGYFERSGFRGTRIVPDALDLLISACGSDLRKLEGLLYEVYQGWDAEGPIEEGYINKVLEALT